MDPLVNADFTTKRKTSFSFLSKLVSPNHSEKKILTIKIHFTKIFSPLDVQHLTFIITLLIIIISSLNSYSVNVLTNLVA